MVPSSQGRYSPAIDGLVFCRAGAILFEFGSQDFHLSQNGRGVLGWMQVRMPKATWQAGAGQLQTAGNHDGGESSGSTAKKRRWD